MNKTNTFSKAIYAALFAGALLCVGSSAFAQVKIGDNPTTINGGSVLELESTNKGLLMPRVSLTTTTTWSLAGTAVAGMHVYNSNAGITSSDVLYPTLDAKIGEYYWDGTGWVALAAAGTAEMPLLLKISGGTTISFNTGVHKLNFTTIDFDRKGNANVTTDVITIPVSGYYNINAKYTTVLTSTIQGSYLGLYVNNVLKEIIAAGNSGVNAGTEANGSSIRFFNAGDVIHFAGSTSGMWIRFQACDISMSYLSK